MELQTQQQLSQLNTYRSDGGLTVRELKNLDQNRDGFISPQEGGSISPKDLGRINAQLMVHGHALNHVAFTNAELNSTLFPRGVDGINPNDIQQGGLGDCYFLSALANLAQQRPQAIINMITDHGNGTYTVRFPGAKRPVTVSMPNDTWRSGDGFDRNNQSNGSRWVAVMEKAFVDYTMKENTGTVKSTLKNTATTALHIFSPLTYLIPDKILNPPPTDPQEHFSMGGFQGDAIKILTRHHTDIDILALTRNSTTERKLQSALKNKQIITATTVMNGSDYHNLSSDHVYSVLDYDSKRKRLTIRNPHGSGSDATHIQNPDTLNDGIFQLTLDEFNKHFTMIAYEEG